MERCPTCQQSYARTTRFCTRDGSRLFNAEEAARMPAGGDILGPYRLEAVLGEGGMGVVYRGQHLESGQRVAIKVLRPDRAVDAALVERFFAEARAVDRMQHDNIVKLFDFAADAGDLKYFTMELLEGESLRARLCRESIPPASVAVHVARQIALALVTVHEAGVVHRDLKPENVFLCGAPGRTAAPRVKLLDFGVAKVFQELEARTSPQLSTVTGGMVGTPEYMSPEQLTGREIGPATDIYALGLLCYEMLAGRKPFSGNSFGDLVIKHVTVEPTRPSKLQGHEGISKALENLILDCLAKGPHERPPAVEVAARLRDLDLDAPLPRRRRKAKALLALGAASTLGMAALLWLPPPGSPKGDPKQLPPMRSRAVDRSGRAEAEHGPGNRTVARAASASVPAPMSTSASLSMSAAPGPSATERTPGLAAPDVHEPEPPALPPVSVPLATVRGSDGPSGEGVATEGSRRSSDGAAKNRRTHRKRSRTKSGRSAELETTAEASIDPSRPSEPTGESATPAEQNPAPEVAPKEDNEPNADPPPPPSPPPAPDAPPAQEPAEAKHERVRLTPRGTLNPF